MPENAGFFQAAYAAAAVIYGGYIVSLWWRGRRTRERLEATTRHGEER